MLNSFSSKILKKSTVFVVLAILASSLTGCGIFTMAKDAIFWLPKKIISAPGKIWDSTGGKDLKEQREWQKRLDLGPRRTPNANPGAGGQGNMPYPQQGGGYQQRGPYPYPSVNQQQQYGTPMPGGYPPQQQPYGAYQQNKYGQQQNRGPSGGYQQGGSAYPPQMQGSYPPQQQAYPSGRGGYQQQQPYPPYQGQSGGYPPQPYFDGQNSAPPFQPAYNRKLIRKFEPMAMEYTIDGELVEREEVNAKFEPLDLEILMRGDDEDFSRKYLQAKDSGHKKNRVLNTGSMFPLDNYAPKSTVQINKILDSSSLARNASDPFIQKLDADVEALLKQLESQNEIISPTIATSADISILDDKVASNESNNKEIKEMKLPASLPKLVAKDIPKLKKKEAKAKKNKVKISKAAFSVKQEEEAMDILPPPLLETVPLTRAPIIGRSHTPEFLPPVVSPQTRRQADNGQYIRKNSNILRGILPRSRYKNRKF